MSCYSCGASFGRFKKEQGCKNCGYAFCKDCLSKKAEIPRLNNEKHKVCLKCYKMLTGQQQPQPTQQQYSPPQALKKRLAQLENKSNQPNQLEPRPSSSHGKVPKKFQGMSKEDMDIAARLQKLKENKDEKAVPSEKEMQERLKKLKHDPSATPPPSDTVMAARLAQLKGQNPNIVNKPHVFTTDRRNQIEQVDDLLQEICDEVEIDSHGINPTEDVQNRLDSFGGSDMASNNLGDVQNNLNKPDIKDQSQYMKNIPQIDSKYESSSGEAVDWSEMNQLIHQVANEMDVDAKKAIAGLHKDKELRERLNNLKKKNNKTSGTETENDEKPLNTDDIDPMSGEDMEEENEEEACKTLIKQLLEESRLDELQEEEDLTSKRMNSAPTVPKHMASSSSKKSDRNDSPPQDNDDEEFPWCCICNDNASLRCMGCDGDLYCKRCYKQGHDKEDYEDHQTKPFKPPNK